MLLVDFSVEFPVAPTPTPEPTPPPDLSWSDTEKDVIKDAADLLADKLKVTINAKHPSWQLTSDDAFMLVYKNTVMFTKTGEICLKATGFEGCWAETQGRNLINVHRDVETPTGSKIKDSVSKSSYHWAIHELGHAFVHATGLAGPNADNPDPNNPVVMLQVEIDTNSNMGRPPKPEIDENGNFKKEILFWGFAGNHFDWQNSWDGSSSEVFADMFLGWTYDRWEIGKGTALSADGTSRKTFMDTNMPDWIEAAINSAN